MELHKAAEPPQPSTLPEVAPQEESTPKYLHTAADPTAYPNYAPVPQYPEKPNRFTRWPFLLLCAFLIAAISGLVGGFIGKAITDSKHKDSSSPPPALACPTNSSTPIPDPTPSPTDNVDITHIALPVTGCPNGNGQVLQSNNTHVTYKKYCNIDWGSHDIVMFLAPTMDDCIEACDAYNSNRGGDLSTPMCEDDNVLAKECVGAAFTPQWAVNRTWAMDETSKAGNCFLKNLIAGYPPNEREEDGVEMVGLCLEGKCPQGGGTLWR